MLIHSAGADAKARGLIQSTRKLGKISPPVLIGSGLYENFSANSITYPSINPNANSLILIHFNYRNTSTINIDNAVANFGTAIPISIIDTDSDLVSSLIVTYAFYCVASGSPGSGTISISLSGNTSQRSLEVYMISTGFDLSNPIRQFTRSI